MTAMKKKICILGSTLAIVGAGASAVYARSFSAFLGQPQNPAQYTSFTNSGGAIGNVGPGTRRYCWSLPVDVSGFKAVSFLARGSGTNQNVSCFASGVDRNNLGTGFSGLRALSAFGSFQTIALPSVFVVSDGGLYACCDMDQGSVVSIVNYNQ